MYSTFNYIAVDLNQMIEFETNKFGTQDICGDQHVRIIWATSTQRYLIGSIGLEDELASRAKPVDHALMQ